MRGLGQHDLAATHPASAGPELTALTTAMIETDAVTLHDYLRVVRRRKWMVVQAALLLTLAAVAYSLHQQRRYEASADVLLSAENLSAHRPRHILLNVFRKNPGGRPRRRRRSRVCPRSFKDALRYRSAEPGLTVTDFLANSSVSTSPTSDILTFAVTNPDSALAEQLANAYAQSYSTYRQHLYTDSIQRAIADVDQRLQRLDRTGASLKKNGGGAGLGALTAYGALYSSLVDRQETLQSMQALQPSVASVLWQADGAVLTQPKTVRNGRARPSSSASYSASRLAFLREALETRVRTTEEVSARLGGLPLLGRLPRPPKGLQRYRKLVMLEDPASAPGRSVPVFARTWTS